MNYLATTLMSIFPLYEAFICFTNLVLGNAKDRSLLYSMYTFDVERISAYNKIFNKLLDHYSPDLFELLETHSINSQVYTLPWWYTLYSNSLQLDKTLAVWDIMLIFGDISIIKFGVFLLMDLQEKMQDEIRQNGYIDIRAIIEEADIGRVIRKVVESQDIAGKISGKIGLVLNGKIGNMLGVKGRNIDFGDLNQWVLGEILSHREEKER